MNYGVPYQGSKNRIAKDIIELLPSGHRFVDLFAGGCAMTHCASLSDKWDKVLSNDKYPLLGQQVFIQACDGEFNKPEYERIVGYDEFYRDRFNKGWFIAVWGFNGKPLYIGKKYETMAHEAGITTIQGLADAGIQFPTQRLRRLQRLSGVDISRVDFTQMDYLEYEYCAGDVVYADPPYFGTDSRYGAKFNHEMFWQFVRTRDYPVYVSEYSAPDDFVSVWSKNRGGIQNAKGYAKNTIHIEHIFIHEQWRNN